MRPRIKPYDIHDILAGKDTVPEQLTPESIQHLIHQQALTHRAECIKNSRDLTRLFRKNSNAIKGFVLYSHGLGSEVGYAVYSPAIGRRGEPAAYCKEFLVCDGYRGLGIKNMLFQELSARVCRDGAQHLSLVADNRNDDVKGYATRKLQAAQTSTIPLDASRLLDEDYRRSLEITNHWDWVKANYHAKLIDPRKHTPLIESLSDRAGTNDRDEPWLHRNTLSITGSHKERGLLVFQNGNPDPVAYAATWRRTSTFRQTQGLELEHPLIIDPANRGEVLMCIADKASEIVRKSHELSTLGIHVSMEEPEIFHMLHNQMHLPHDSMVGTPNSRFVVFNLSREQLENVRDRELSWTIEIPHDRGIGPSSLKASRRPKGGEGRDIDAIPSP